ncbi:MAG: hypothetical protein Lokiarch_36850 [Candidatus Lokiarchaeum sp. GC14_75]|nr:MAG: hypothetical protein Lokiarch_36850 [Candidatus Lokiarchaeum sp. GC14_75]
MVDIGGKNLPKAISSKSGAKLGKLYQKRGLVFDIENALNQIYSVLNGKTTIKKLNANSYEVIVKYPKKFCPIGGSNNSSRALVFQENVCVPYTKGFLNELFPHDKFETKIHNCIPLDDHRTCHYHLNVTSRKNPT